MDKEFEIPVREEIKIIKEPFQLGTKFKLKSVDINKNIVGDYKVICLYFGGYQCPPCQGFLPKLIQFYNEINTEEKVLEVIYVPHDTSDEDYKIHTKAMPWLCLPFSDERVTKYEENYNIKGIPMLIVIKPNLEVANMKAKLDVFKIISEGGDPEIVYNKWCEQIYQK